MMEYHIEIHREENRRVILERQIDNAVSMNCERVRDLFNRLDNLKNGTISTNDLRSIVEDLIDYTLKPDEFYNLIKQIPIVENGRIIVNEYLKQVVDRRRILQEQQHKKLLKENGHLELYQFLREFGHSKRSAHYPNAKQNPPKRVDADFLLTSKKLYGDSVLVHGTVINSIKSNWNKLHIEFTDLDPYRTGFIKSDEFDEIFTELCPSVNQQDFALIKYNFQTQNDLRINYVRFLKDYAPIPELIGLIGESNRKNLPAINDRSPRGISHKSVLNQLSNKLRRKLSDHIKELRRALKQRDPTNSGSVAVQAFKEILNKYKCVLNDEEFYSLTSKIDTKMDGTIDFKYFIQQCIKNT